MRPLDFEWLAREQKAFILQLCIICLIKALKPPGYDKSETSPKPGLSMFNGGILNGIGLNTHQAEVYYDDELKIQPKKKFEVTAHRISPQFKRCSLPGN